MILKKGFYLFFSYKRVAFTPVVGASPKHPGVVPVEGARGGPEVVAGGGELFIILLILLLFINIIKILLNLSFSTGSTGLYIYI